MPQNLSYARPSNSRANNEFRRRAEQARHEADVVRAEKAAANAAAAAQQAAAQQAAATVAAATTVVQPQLLPKPTGPKPANTAQRNAALKAQRNAAAATGQQAATLVQPLIANAAADLEQRALMAAQQELENTWNNGDTQVRKIFNAAIAARAAGLVDGARAYQIGQIAYEMVSLQQHTAQEAAQARLNPAAAATAATAAAVPAATSTEAAAAALAALAALANGKSQPEAAAAATAAAKNQGATPTQAKTLGSAAAAATATAAAPAAQANPSGPPLFNLSGLSYPSPAPPAQHYPYLGISPSRGMSPQQGRTHRRYPHIPIHLPSNPSPAGASAPRLPKLGQHNTESGVMPSSTEITPHLPSSGNDNLRRELCALTTFHIPPKSTLYPQPSWSTAKKRSFNSQCNHVARIRKRSSRANELGKMYGYNIPMYQKQQRYSSRKKHEFQPTRFNKVSNRLYSQTNINKRRLATKKNLQQRVRPWRGGRTRRGTMRNRTQKRK